MWFLIGISAAISALLITLPVVLIKRRQRRRLTLQKALGRPKTSDEVLAWLREYHSKPGNSPVPDPETELALEMHRKLQPEQENHLH